MKLFVILEIVFLVSYCSFAQDNNIFKIKEDLNKTKVNVTATSEIDREDHEKVMPAVSSTTTYNYSENIQNGNNTFSGPLHPKGTPPGKPPIIRKYKSEVLSFPEPKDDLFYTLKDLSTSPRCLNLVKDTCERIKVLRNVSCIDGKIIRLDQLCDGRADCWNYGDEYNCTSEVGERIRQIIKILNAVRFPLNLDCLPDRRLPFRYEFLENSVRVQWDLYKHLLSPMTVPQPKPAQGHTDAIYYMKPKEVSTLLSSVLYSLEGTLCTPRVELEKNNLTTRTTILPVILDLANEVEGQAKWSPTSCTCKHQFCKAVKCDKRCKRVCWQKHSLNHWGCQSLTGATTISLENICDGKIDCVDETDESQCTTNSTITNNDADKYYKLLTELIYENSVSIQYRSSRKNLLNLLELARKLQNITQSQNVNAYTVKTLRNKYFNLLVHTYEDMLQILDKRKLDEAHDFLLTLNEKMVEALKRSHTGNDDLSASGECICSNGECVLVRCKSKCIATCLVRPIFLRYSCGEKQSYVALKKVCDGKDDCKNEEDELGCSKDVCDARHMIELHGVLDKAGMIENRTSASTKNVLNNWKMKVIQLLDTAVTEKTVARKNLEDIVAHALDDLVAVYASKKDVRSGRNRPELVMREFQHMADIVKLSLKSCTK